MVFLTLYRDYNTFLLKERCPKFKTFGNCLFKLSKFTVSFMDAR